MRQFIFFTTEGHTFAPDGCNIENCQVLGDAAGETPEEALDNLLSNNPWIKDTDFHIHIGKIVACELMNTNRYYL